MRWTELSRGELVDAVVAAKGSTKEICRRLGAPLMAVHRLLKEHGLQDVHVQLRETQRERFRLPPMRGRVLPARGIIEVEERRVYARHEVGVLVWTDPVEARRRILEAFRQAGASPVGAARVLGCTDNTWTRWVARLQLREEIAKLRESAIAEGWYHGRHGGRPAGSRDSQPRHRRTRAEIDAARLFDVVRDSEK
jgi:transposase-like protein